VSTKPAAAHTEAIGHYREALQLGLDVAENHNQLGLALALAGDRAGAIEEYRIAAKLRPEEAIYRYNLGALLTDAAYWDEATSELREALRLRPDFDLAQVKLEKLGQSRRKK
jgi:tetratricopeptide (TPR) repeat protein